MNIALVMTAEVAMNIVICLEMLCSGSPEYATDNKLERRSSSKVLYNVLNVNY